MASFPVPLDDLFAQLPSEDRSYASNLQDPDAVSRWALSLADDYRRRITELLGTISTLCSIHNAVLPIRRLPTEIVSQVFADPILDRDDLAVTQVSRYWRAVVLDTPQFWANVLASVHVPFHSDQIDRDSMCERTDEPPYMGLCISRSGALPLRIESYGRASLWERLVDVKERLYDLDLYLGRSSKALQRLISSKMTRLTRLKVAMSTHYWHYLDGGFKLDAQDLPRLRDLTLFRLHLLPVSTDVLTLTHLVLSLAEYSVPRLVGVLKKCPRLESLTLFDITTTDTEVGAVDATFDSFGQGDPDKPLILPQLRTLNIDPLQTAPTLTCLTFPPSTRLSLEVPFLEYPSVLEAASSWITPSIDSDWLHISIPHHGLHSVVTFLCYVQQREKLRLTTRFTDPPSRRVDNPHYDAEFLATFLSLPMLTTLSLDLPSHPDPPNGAYQTSPAALSAWLSLLFEALPHVRTLELLSFEDNSHTKRDTAERFLLDRKKRNVGGLTLVWALPPSHRHPKGKLDPPYSIYDGEPYRESGWGAMKDLRLLLEMLRVYDDVGKARLQRLELRRPDHRVELFDSSGKYVEPPNSTPGWYEKWVISELRKLVDELVLDLP